MKIKLLLASLLLIISLFAKAQYVTIPDPNFAAYLQTYYPSCMNGNQMDTTCIDITSATTTTLDVSYQNISDLTGVEYFSGLIYLYCTSNLLTSLPNLPANLQQLYCEENQLTNLPSLPSNLQDIDCTDNQLTNLPNLPANLQRLYCGFNLLTGLPNLPASLEELVCYNNQLTSLPSLPASLQLLDCASNNITCFPIFPSSLNNPGDFYIINNPFTCLPNYVAAMDNLTLAYPLCVNGDTVTNPYGCASTEGIVGSTFKDNNSNCTKDNGDIQLNNIPVKIYDNTNILLAQTNSFLNGIYNFSDSSGTYKVEIDTIAKPYFVQCNNPGIDTTITLSTINPLASDINFNIACKPGFDIGVQSVVPSGWVFPGQQHQIKVMAGDMSNWYNLNCAAGVSGQVEIIVSGNVTYDGVAAGALIPNVAGNVFTYTIADFGTINNGQDFGLLFTTDTTAQAGDLICVDINVTPLIADNDTSNNSYQFCYQVINSYDPNMKEVFPVNVLPGFEDWFTYTIHFQNTGSAPAFNIRLTDTLSNNLDLETFQVINYSHYNNVALNNNLLTFRFPNIMLPDSTSNLEGSKGFVQYRIKPKANLPLGTQIRNTANIYFDYNPPIITNTTINEFVQPVSIGAEISNLNSQLYIYPNPSNGIFNLKTKQLEDLKINSFEVFDILGQKVFDANDITISSSSNSQIDLSNQPNGIYFVKANGLNKSFSKKIIKQ
jgi:uncharacterized repeat protein (TIGR01451 family)